MAEMQGSNKTVPPVTVEGLVAQRQNFWQRFNSATLIAIVVVAVIVVLVVLQIS